jgi:hypothetical protein
MANILLAKGNAVSVQFTASATITCMDIRLADESTLSNMPGIYIQINAGAFVPISANVLSSIAIGNAVSIRLDCTRISASNELVGIFINRSETSETLTLISDEQLFGDKTVVKAVDLAMLTSAVEDTQIMLIAAAELSNGWPIKYYQAKVISSVPILSATTLKSIRDVKNFDVFFPKSKHVGRLDFDQFGMIYDELTNIHISYATWIKHYGVGTRPMRQDIVYLPTANQMFEVQHVDDVQTATNNIAWYDVTLQFVSDRKEIAKDNDILDLSALIDTHDTKALADYKEALNNESLGITVVDLTYPSVTFRKLILSDVRELTLQPDDLEGKAFYAIVHLPDAPNWFLASITNQEFKLYSLTDFIVLETEPFDAELTIEVARYAIFNDVLTTKDFNMFMTGKVLPPNLQPLDYLDKTKDA